jgi:hypothetical protein
MEFAMNAMTISRMKAASAGAQAVKASPGDPLDADSPFDDVVITTSRALCRLALVATETGARFQREAEPHDPMSWMLAPRKMFGGSTALEACLEREHFMRALLLHGLSLGLDAAPEEIDDLIDDPNEVRVVGRRRRGTSRAVARLRLYTATVLRSTSGTMLQAFHASVASSVEEFRGRLEEEFGSAAAERAEIRVGFDPAASIVLALVPAPVAKVLRKVDRESAAPAYGNFAVTIEHRLEA